MSKIVITSMLALGLGIAAMTAGHAAVPSVAGDRAAAPIGMVQLAQAPGGGVPRGGVRGPAGVPRGNVGVPQRGFVPRGNVGGPQRGFGGGPAYVGRPGYVGRPVGVGRPLGVVGAPAYVGRPAFVRGYRPFYRRPWFGTVLGGVALGTFLTVATVGIAPAYAPAPGLCWYWADPSLTQGYWDYCQAPY